MYASEGEAWDCCGCGGSNKATEGGRRSSWTAFAMRTRLPNATIPISVFSRLASSSRRTSPVISCSGRYVSDRPLTKGKSHTDKLAADILIESLTLQPVNDFFY
jgi:hypothetical protein